MPRRAKLRIPVIVVHWKDASSEHCYLEADAPYDPSCEIIWVGHEVRRERGHITLATGLIPREKRYKAIYNVPDECVIRTKRGVVEI